MRTNVTVQQEVTLAVEEVEIESRTGAIIPVGCVNKKYFNGFTRKKGGSSIPHRGEEGVVKPTLIDFFLNPTKLQNSPSIGGMHLKLFCTNSTLECGFSNYGVHSETHLYPGKITILGIRQKISPL